MSRYNHYGWSPYVPVAERRAKAAKQMDKLRKKGVEIQPVTIEGRTIARSFWGKAWCDHLDSFGDYSNRLPRGRSYVRNGSVCHLDIGKGKVEAIVSGSMLYTVTMEIQTLPTSQWAGVKKRCAGGIGSLLELLQGKLSHEIMSVVTDRANGLFPGPREIQYQCNCPDYAGMCKHIAAVVYGIGARLDERPELLFVLRGVDHGELISTDAAITGALANTRSTRRRTLAANQLDNVFGVEFETPEETVSPMKAGKKPVRKTPGEIAKKTSPKLAKETSPKPDVKPARKIQPFRATARSIRKLRSSLSLSRAEFANRLGVSAQSVVNWEGKTGPLNVRAASLARLQELARQVKASS